MVDNVYSLLTLGGSPLRFKKQDNSSGLPEMNLPDSRNSSNNPNQG